MTILACRKQMKEGERGGESKERKSPYGQHKKAGGGSKYNNELRSVAYLYDTAKKTNTTPTTSLTAPARLSTTCVAVSRPHPRTATAMGPRLNTPERGVGTPAIQTANAAVTAAPASQTPPLPAAAVSTTATPPATAPPPSPPPPRS